MRLSGVLELRQRFGDGLRAASLGELLRDGFGELLVGVRAVF